MEEKQTLYKNREEFLLKFKKALESMPMDNIITKKKGKATTYTKEQVKQFINNPSGYQEQLTNLIDNLCLVYPQFNILCEYLANMALINYIIVPNLEKSDKVDADKLKKDYVKVAQYVQNMNIKHEFKRGIKFNFKYDTFFGYEVENKDSYFIKQLNPKYCRIYGKEDGVYLIQFDFSYFNGTNEKLVYGDELGQVAYPEEFKTKYNIYKANKNENTRWQSLEFGIATKYNETIEEYSTPPFASLMFDLVDIEEFKALSRSKAETDIWKLLTMEVPLKKDASGEDDFALSMDAIELFNSMAQQQLPDGVGVITTPMKTEEISFNKSSTSERNNVQDAINILFDNAGFSKAVFSNADNSTTLKYSTMVDEMRLYGLYRQYERIVNRKLKKRFSGKFKIKILDMGEFTKKDIVDQLLKTSQASLPTKTMLVGALGIEPMEMLGLETLENEVLKCSEKWLPLQSSYTQSGKDSGRPLLDDGDISPSGQQTREIDGNATKS